MWTSQVIEMDSITWATVSTSQDMYEQGAVAEAEETKHEPATQ